MKRRPFTHVHARVVVARRATLALALLCTCVVANEARAQAAPLVQWHTQAPPTVAATDDIAGVALENGHGFAVSFDAGAGGANAHVYRVDFSPTTSPAFGAAFHDTSAINVLVPTVSLVGTRLLVTGNNDKVLPGDNTGVFAAEQSTNAFTVPTQACAVDAGGTGEVMCAIVNSAGAQGNVVHGTNGGRAFDAPILMDQGSSTPVSVAFSAPDGVVATDDGRICGSGAASAVGSWLCSVALLPGIDQRSRVALLPSGEFVVVGAGGAVYLVPDAENINSVTDCSVAALAATSSRITAVASDGSSVWLADDRPFISRVDPTTCPWDLDALGDSFAVGAAGAGALTRVDAIAAAPNAVVAVGVAGAAPGIAWHNRAATLTLLSSSTIAIDEGATAPVSASVVDPDDDDASGMLFTWDCGALVIDTPDQPSAVVHAPAQDGAFCVGSAARTFACSVTSTETGGQTEQQTFNVGVLPIDVDNPVIGAIAVVDTTHSVDVAAGGPALEGSTLSATVPASDDCPAAVTWEFLDGTGQPLQAPAPLPFGAPFTLNVPVTGVTTSYTVRAVATDTAGKSTAPVLFTFNAVPPTPPEITLLCPPDPGPFAGDGAVVVAVDATAPGFLQRIDWSIDPLGPASDNDHTFTVDPDFVDRCDFGGAVTVSATPIGAGTLTGQTKTCTWTWQRDRQETKPRIDSVSVGDRVVHDDGRAFNVGVSLTLAGVSEVVGANVSECAGVPVSVTWKLDALPDALEPAGVTSDGVFHGAAWSLSASPDQVLALDGQDALLRIEAVNDLGSPDGSVSAPVHVRFSLAKSETANAHLAVNLVIDDATSENDVVAAGDFVVVSGTVTSDLAVALPNIDVALDGDGLKVVPGSGTVTSDCGARGSVVDDGGRGGAHLKLDGVNAACPATLRLLARRGLRAGGVVVGACTWGAGNELAGCTGGVDVDEPKALALSCASAGDVAEDFVFATLVAAVLVFAKRRRHR